MMAETNSENKSDESTIRHRDIGCDSEQQSLIPKRVASEKHREKVSGCMESVITQLMTQMKIFSWFYIFCSIVTLFILIISFMQGRLYFYFNNANCAVECFTNPLDQTIPNVVELHKNYKSCYEAYIIMQDKNERQDKQLADIQKEKNDLIKALDNTRKELGMSTKKLDTYKKYLEFIGSIDVRIQNMDTCNSYVKIYCDCLMDKNAACALRYLKYLGCKDALPENYYTTIKGPYTKLLDDVLMVKKNLTHLLITGNFELMHEIYEKKKNLPMDNCQFICGLDVEDIDSKFDESDWKFFEDGWKLFSKYFLAYVTT